MNPITCITAVTTVYVKIYFDSRKAESRGLKAEIRFYFVEITISEGRELREEERYKFKKDMGSCVMVNRKIKEY
jgi:hypothetical protein